MLSEAMQDKVLSKLLHFVSLKDDYQIEFGKTIWNFKGGQNPSITETQGYCMRFDWHKDEYTLPDRVYVGTNAKTISLGTDVSPKTILIHELTHKLAYDLFTNIFAQPYIIGIGGRDDRTIFSKIFETVNEGVSKYSSTSECETESLQSIKDIMAYSEHEQHAEMFARYTEIIASDCYYNNPGIQTILKPLKAYYEEKVEPLIDQEIARMDQSSTCAALNFVDSFAF